MITVLKPHTKYKLIDMDGYLKADATNGTLLAKNLVDGCFLGDRINLNGTLVSCEGDLLIQEEEMKYFEEYVCEEPPTESPDILQLELAMGLGYFLQKLPMGTLTNRQYFDILDYVRDFKGDKYE